MTRRLPIRLVRSVCPMTLLILCEPVCAKILAFGEYPQTQVIAEASQGRDGCRSSGELLQNV